MTEDMTTLSLKELSQSLSAIDNVELMEEFLKCLLTENEVLEVTSRWALVKKIRDGQTQRSIASELGLSLCKITRGSKELKKDNSAFRQVLEVFDSLDTK